MHHVVTLGEGGRGYGRERERQRYNRDNLRPKVNEFDLLFC